MNSFDKKRLLIKLECLDDYQLDRIESLVCGMEKQRKRLKGSKMMRHPLKRNGENMIHIADVS